jgi:hypothetical protein
MRGELVGEVEGAAGQHARPIDGWSPEPGRYREVVRQREAARRTP